MSEQDSIINIILVEAGDSETLNNLVAFHGASYALDFDEVGHPFLISDFWNKTTLSWDTVEVLVDINTIDMSQAIQKPTE
jgi:hypothetical protein